MSTSGDGSFGVYMRELIADLSARNPDLAAAARVQRAWRRSAPADVLGHTDAVYVVPATQASEVVIYVDAPIWATELSLQSELFRLKLNVELNAMLEEEGRAPARRDEDVLFDIASAEQVKKLSFAPSKEKYTGRFAQAVAAEEQMQREAHIEPVPLSGDELSLLEDAVAGIEDAQVRSAAFDAAKAHLELHKARKARKPPDTP